MRAGVVLLVLSTLGAAVGGFSFVLVRRGGERMDESDQAFHRGDLRASLYRARDAGLLFVPGASHVRAAEERLRAIAVGAEAEADFELAWLAWDALRLVDEETTYLGRGDTEAGRQAREGLERLRRRRASLDAHP